jgi:hypothetical protein
MRKGVKFRSSWEPIERRTSAPAPYDTTVTYISLRWRGGVKHRGKARTSVVSCERTFFTTLLDIEEAITVALRKEMTGG